MLHYSLFVILVDKITVKCIRFRRFGEKNERRAKKVEQMPRKDSECTFLLF